MDPSGPGNHLRVRVRVRTHRYNVCTRGRVRKCKGKFIRGNFRTNHFDHFSHSLHHHTHTHTSESYRCRPNVTQSGRTKFNYNPREGGINWIKNSNKSFFYTVRGGKQDSSDVLMRTWSPGARRTFSVELKMKLGGFPDKPRDVSSVKLAGRGRVAA